MSACRWLRFTALPDHMLTSEKVMKPGESWFGDCREGDRYETGRIVVTEAHIVACAGISGDFFDIHMDDEFARAQGFPARVAHGLWASL